MSLVLCCFARKKKVQVLNEGMIISEEEVARFVSAIFTAFQSVNVISFHVAKPDIRTLPFPYQRFNCTEDIVLALPPVRFVSRSVKIILLMSLRMIRHTTATALVSCVAIRLRERSITSDPNRPVDE